MSIVNHGTKLTVAALQSDIRWLDKRANLEHIDQLTLGLENIDLLLLPETFSTGFAIDVDSCGEPEKQGEVLSWLKEKAKSLGSVVAGTVLVQQGDMKVNRFYWAYPDGEIEYYDKRHLFRMGNEQKYVVAGNKRKLITIKGIKILPLVCYDLRFPVWSRNVDDYQLMVNVANWPAARRRIWDTLLRARAMENLSYVIGVNRVGSDGQGIRHSGGTTICDYTGETIVQADDNKEQLIKTILDFSELAQFKSNFPANLDADQFIIQ